MATKKSGKPLKKAKKLSGGKLQRASLQRASLQRASLQRASGVDESE